MNVNKVQETKVTKVTEGINQSIKELDNLNKLGYVNSRERVLNESICPSLVKIMKLYELEKHPIRALSDKDLKKVVKWSYNKYVLEMYLHLLKEEQSLMEQMSVEEMMDFKVLKKELFNKMDPSIRVKIMDKGMSVLKNIYSGFDTEYQTLGMSENKLLSVQLAINTKVVIVLPLVKDFVISKINAQTGETYGVLLNIKGYKFKELEQDLNRLIKEIRMIRFYAKDVSIQKLIDGLKKRGLLNVEKDDSIYFSFERTPIRTW
jgi:hypothetical protein